MDWLHYIKQLKPQDPGIEFQFHSPVQADTLFELQKCFKINELPNELLELYTQTNGIDEKLDGTVIGEFIWSVERVIESNLDQRNYPSYKDIYMSFDQLLFFSDAGNGDLFGFSTLNGKFDRSDIFIWDHEDDSRTWVAPNLATFIEWWNNGKIEI